MNDDLRKLLAGYMTGTLTEAERKALFEAALTDEELFAAISDDEPLRELLTDPAARAELLSRIDPAPVTFRDRFAQWLRQPMVMASFASMAVAVVVLSIVPLLRDQQPSVVARLSTPPPTPQMTRTPEAFSDAAKTQRETRPRRLQRSPAVATPAAAARRNEEAQPASAPAPVELTDDAAAVQPGRAAGYVAAPLASEKSELPPPPAPSARMAALPGQAAEARADVPRLLATTKATAQAAAPIRSAVLKKSGSGIYSEVDPEKTVFSAGDVVRIRLEPAESGLATIQGATPQPIVQTLTKGRGFETGDILVGAEDMRLIISFSTGFPAVSALRTSAASEPKPAQPVEIVLRVKKP